MSAHHAAPLEADTLVELAGEVDRRFAELEALAAEDRQRALALKNAIEAFHRDGLATIVRRLRDDERGRELLVELARAAGVYALLSMHGLIDKGEEGEESEKGLELRVAAALDACRPYLRSHGGDVELVEVRDGVAVVRLVGTCDGCSMSSATLRRSVEEAVRERVPEIERVEEVGGRAKPAVVPLSTLRGKRGGGWVAGPRAEDVPDGAVTSFEAGEASILVVRRGDRLRAFKNACPHMGRPLDRARVDPATGALVCPWHGLDFDGVSGECTSRPDMGLEPFPLRVEDGTIWVRPA